MGTYYGYVERTADSYINWAEIGKNFSDTIAEVDRKRQEKKAEIDKSVKEVIDYLANSPQGESKTVRGMALEYSGNATEYLLDLQRKLKAGQIKLDDFLSKRQNIEDGTERAFTMMSEYQKEYGDRMERYRKGESSILEVENMGQIENFGDFSKSGLFINPLTGAVNVAMKEERDIDGKKVFAMSANPSKIMSIDSARNLLTTKYNIYDYNKVSETFSKTMGKNIEAIYKSAGLTGTIEDITSREYKDPKTKEMIFNFQQAETKGIEALLSNWSDRASLLLDNNVPCSANGELYRITYDPNDKAPEAVYVEVDAQGRQNVNFTDVQKKDSFNFMRDDIRRRYTYIENVSRPAATGYRGGRTPSQGEIDRKNAQTAWNQMFYGEPALKKSAANSLLNTPAAISKGLVGIDFDSSPGDMILTFRDKEGKETTQSIVMDPNQTTFGEFAQQGAVVSGITDMNEAIRIGGNPMGLKASDLTPNADFSATMVTKAPVKNLEPVFKSAVGKLTANAEDIFGSQQEDAADAISVTLAEFGDAITVTPTGSGAKSRVTVQIQGAEPIEIETYRWGSGNQKESLNDLLQYLNNNKDLLLGSSKGVSRPNPTPQPAQQPGAASLNATNRKK